MSIEGELIVRVTWDGERVAGVDVRSTRPHLVSRLVHGQRSDAAVDIVANLHAVCGGAHRAVAATACDAASGREVACRILLQREHMIELEALQEHCTRLGLHWAEAMRTPALLPLVRDVRALAAPVLAAQAMDPEEVERAIERIAPLAGAALLGMSPQAWLDLSTVDELDDWSERAAVAPAQWWTQLMQETPRLGCCPIELMPCVDSHALESTIAPRLRASDRFAHCPDWDGRPVETGVLSQRRSHPLVADALRVHGNSVATRLIARLTDLAALLQRDHEESPSLLACAVDGHAYATAVTARGVLVHAVALRDGVIDDYAIVAPTEWNFHPQGAFVTALAACEADNERDLMRAATILTQAIDPCVRCTIEVGHA